MNLQARPNWDVRSVLFVCEDNARYSLIAEALFRDGAGAGVRAFSAGLEPADAADPFALSALSLAGLGPDGLWPKHWDGFCERGSRIIDTVVTIGERTAERLPRVFPGLPEYRTWRIGTAKGVKPMHEGVWRDIQTLRPLVTALIDELCAPQSDAPYAPASGTAVPAE